VESFDRQQILLLSFDELRTNETSFLQRLHTFLDLEVTATTGGDRRLPHTNDMKRHDGQGLLKQTNVSCELQEKLARVFEPYNTQLYTFLEQFPGTPWEQRPFPHFDTTCNPNLSVYVPT
jgi:hypothetical protein